MKNKWVQFGVGVVALLVVAGLSLGAVMRVQAQASWFNFGSARVLPVAWAGGLRGGDFGQRAGSLATIAKALGISESDLTTALQGGKTVADVATEKGVDLSKVVDAIVAEQTVALKQAVSSGRITQAQADDRLAKLKTNLPTMLSTKLPTRPQGFSPRGGGMGPFGSPATIAKALGISESDLSTALQSGKSIADVATEKGVDLSKVVDAIVAEQTEALKQAVSSGRITQAQADNMIAKLKTNLPTMLSMKHGAGDKGPGHHFGGRGAGQAEPQNPQSPLAPGGTEQSSGADPISEPFQST
jgi:hypothetical protein